MNYRGCLALVLLCFLGCQSRDLRCDQGLWVRVQRMWSLDLSGDELGFDPSSELEHAVPFLGLVLQVAQTYQFPGEFVLLPFLHQGYHNQVRGMHAGLWGIHKARCESYGLVCRDDYDQRLHPVHATQAVAKRLRALFVDRGDWFLVFEAFEREQGRGDAFGKALGSWKNWVMRYAQERLSFVSCETWFEVMSLPAHIRLAELAKVSYIDEELFLRLNAGYRDGETLLDDHDVLVPRNSLGDIHLPSSQRYQAPGYLSRLRVEALAGILRHPPKRPNALKEVPNFLALGAL